MEKDNSKKALGSLCCYAFDFKFTFESVSFSMLCMAMQAFVKVQTLTATIAVQSRTCLICQPKALY